MTDITELTSVQKNANIHRLSRLIAYASNDELRQMAVEVEHYTDQLIEALEKAQAVMNAVVTGAAISGVRPFDGIDCDPPTLEENAEACGDAMSARIRELEANPPKPHHNGLMQISNELASAKQRIAELESRTVKLPKLKMLEDYLAEVAIEERKQILVGVKLEFHRACATSGIKVEAE